MLEQNKTVAMIKKHTKYTRSGVIKSFSGSQFGNTLLQNYLITLYGSQEEDCISQSDIGSVFHKGMEDIFRTESFSNNNPEFIFLENKVSRELPNGWALTGTIDRTHPILGADNHTQIRDYKLTKKYSGKTVHKEWYHPYKLQLNSYLYSSTKLLKPTKLFLDLFYKDADVLLKEPGYEEIEVPVFEDFEEIALRVTDELEAAIDSGITPPECTVKEKWLRKLKSGNTVPSRCMAYCGVASKCPYYQTSLKSQIAGW